MRAAAFCIQAMLLARNQIDYFSDTSIETFWCKTKFNTSHGFYCRSCKTFFLIKMPAHIAFFNVTVEKNWALDKEN